MAFEGIKDFSFLFKEDTRATIEVIRLPNSFPSFVNREDNQTLIKEVWIEVKLCRAFERTKVLGPMH